ncbi:MAG: hypothetical protein DHS20C11_31590 [Lysobacteraceae bacterium]|nr:MAG: hypothetical protein DHS20C11_31590 [Xanthomonadaceae bacterium]
MKRTKSECPKALDPAERLDMDVEAGVPYKAPKLRQGRLLHRSIWSRDSTNPVLRSKGGSVFGGSQEYQTLRHGRQLQGLQTGGWAWGK